ncbi:SDR family oxidoreductase, partial [Nonomuraea wenchangensis]
MSSKILVTGATGTVGRALVTELAADPAQPRVLALVRDPAAVLPPRVEPVHGDLTDPASFAAAVEGVTAAFLLWPFGSADGFGAVLD